MHMSIEREYEILAKHRTNFLHSVRRLLSLTSNVRSGERQNYCIGNLENEADDTIVVQLHAT